ncbi:hypothetical protein DK842_05410 [Chromobacterium phragmitis]|uniref:Prepilin-type cleavage/methylation domain-containing protein n=1 Tax=Chromobacterium phragmitis TaxID=2202141 RepID=A0A344UHL2_9NEIS|nr:hypothetical protein [Chromobacterium phragmitis]AXE29387.1 hypothetical protein DK842_05410 [Chromobacterium phragmitis]AXE34760.1 hypothetical protein DK843_10935 [Chromobacterium phragmitis]
MIAGERGFSLVEAQVALLIWALAVLALVSVQAKSLSQARDSEFGGRVGDAVAALASAIQASPESVWPHYLEGGYDDHMSGGDCLTACSAQQLADAALFRFKRALQAEGRSVRARGIVCRGDSKVRPTLANAGCDGKGEWAVRVAWRARLGGKWLEHAGVWPLRP